MYEAAHPEERSCVVRVRELVENHSDCFERTCIPGHITASAWIVSADRRRYLLTHHRKLDRWLQLGGHADGDADGLAVALREAREESGMTSFEVVEVQPGLALFDVDVHLIPAFGGDPAHEHHDLRFLLLATGDQEIEISEESYDVAWFELDEFEQNLGEESLLRMARKSRSLLLGA